MVVLGVQVTGQRGTVGAWNPQVGGPSIQDDLKTLWRRAQRNIGVILGIQIVGKRDIMATGGLKKRMFPGESDFRVGLFEHVQVLGPQVGNLLLKADLSDIFR